jgi:hypothetical protein
MRDGDIEMASSKSPETRGRVEEVVEGKAMPEVVVVLGGGKLGLLGVDASGVTEVEVEPPFKLFVFDEGS